jgi:hypothetical protein
MEARDHTHNGIYVREETCELRHENQRLLIGSLRREIRGNRKLTWAVLAFQFGTLGALLLKWAIG